MTETTPAPPEPEGAPTWAELAEAILAYSEARRMRGGNLWEDFTPKVRQLDDLADRLRPLMPKGD